MAKFSGVVKKVGCFPLKEKDKYDNINRLALQVEIDGKDTWVSMGATKLDGFMVENDDKEWVVLGDGSEVVFKYTQNGEFYNSSKNDLMVLELKEGKKYEPKQAGSNTNSSTGKQNSGSTAAPKVDWDANQKRIIFGMAFNNACQALGASVKDIKDIEITTSELKGLTARLYKLAIEGSEAATKGNVDEWAGLVAKSEEKTVTETVKGRKSTKNQEQQAEQEELKADDAFDDDIPF